MNVDLTQVTHREQWEFLKDHAIIFERLGQIT